MKKGIIIIGIICIALITTYSVNQVIYLSKVQYTCHDKIQRGEDLNTYEILSAYQTHTNLWLFGWLFSANTGKRQPPVKDCGLHCDNFKER